MTTSTVESNTRQNSSRVDHLRRRASSMLWRLGRVVGSGVHGIVGAGCLVVLLAFMMGVPILQFVALGWILVSMGETARTGRIRDSVIGLDFFARLGIFLLVAWIFWTPVRVTQDMLADARLIDPTGMSAERLERWAGIFAMLIGAHLVLAAVRGGKLRHLLWPIGNLTWLARSLYRRSWLGSTILDFDVRCAVGKAWECFSKGTRGFLVAAMVLAIPATLLAVGRTQPLLGWLAAFLLAWVCMYLPFAMARFADENRIWSAFEWKELKRRFERSPISHLLVMIPLAPFMLPLYLLKIEEIPREAVWVPAIVFVVLVWPMKVLWAWAYHAGGQGRSRATWLLRWPCRTGMYAIGLLYVLLVFLSQYTSWRGAQVLYEHPAFLLPVPF